MMRKIQLFIASSLDGYIARSSGTVDWLFTDQDYGYSEFYDQVDTVLMGRKTYEQVLEFGEYPYQEKSGFVFSRTQRKPDQHVTFVHTDWLRFVEALRQLNEKNIWLVGGAELIDYFMQHDLIDELILSIHPIILGDGIPLFTKKKMSEIPLTLKETKTFESGLLQVVYTL